MTSASTPANNPDATTDRQRFIRDLAEQLRRVASSEADWTDLPVPLRAVIAATALAASNQAVNQSSLARSGTYSRTTQRAVDAPWVELLDALAANPGRYASYALADQANGRSAAELAAELQSRDNIIADERRKRREAEAHLHILAAAARDTAHALSKKQVLERDELDARIVGRGRFSLVDGDVDTSIETP
ncbi:MAG: hypothetical protein WD378_02125 [Egicoccus sp.]